MNGRLLKNFTVLTEFEIRKERQANSDLFDLHYRNTCEKYVPRPRDFLSKINFKSEIQNFFRRHSDKISSTLCGAMARSNDLHKQVFGAKMTNEGEKRRRKGFPDADIKPSEEKRILLRRYERIHFKTKTK